MSPSLRISLALLLIPPLLAGCGKGTKEAPTGSGATLSSTPSMAMENRPSAPLGLFVTYYLGGGGIPPANSALTGVEAEVRLNAEFNPLTSPDTYALLQEFGNILQIDIPDLLNRSSDRPTTLTQYTDALNNITERCKAMVTDLTAHQKSIQTKIRGQQSSVSNVQKQISSAFKAGDYSTAGSMQEQLATAQTALASSQADQKETQNLLTTYKKLIDVATRRLDAITKNREALIAGIKVIDVPGIENLGIIQDNSTKPSLFLQ